MAATVTGTLENRIDQEVKLKKKTIWAGNQPEGSINTIPIGRTVNFSQVGDSEGVAGGLEYVWGPENTFKWVIAWSNTTNEIEREHKKVYTQLLLKDEGVDWDQIKRSLDKSGQSGQLLKVQILSEIQTDSVTGERAIVKASIKPGSLPHP